MAQPLPKACCTAPKVIVEGYKPQGDYTSLNGLKTYVTGSSNAKLAILFVYDVFGFVPQTFQGADILAQVTGCLVVMPDFLGGGLPADSFPPDTPEKKKVLDDYLGENGPAYVPRVTKLANSTVESLKAANVHIEKIGGFGLCWGGKVIILAGNEPTSLLRATAQGHPSFLAVEDARSLRVPHLILASKDENVDDVKAFDEVNKPSGSATFTYPTMHHGWMGARAKLEDNENKEQFLRAYEQVGSWFLSVLG